MERSHRERARTATAEAVAEHRPAPDATVRIDPWPRRSFRLELARFVALSERLATIHEPSRIVPALLAELAEVGVAAAGIGVELDGGRLAFPLELNPDGPGAHDDPRRDLATAGTPLAAVFAGGRPVTLSSDEIAAHFPALAALRPVAGAVVLVPIPATGGRLAEPERPSERHLLTLTLAEPAAELDPELRDGLTLLGRLVADALRHVEERRQGARGVLRRNLVARSIAELLPPAPLPVIEARILELAASLSEAARAVLFQTDGDALVVAAARGVAPGLARVGERLPLEGETAVAEAARTGRPVVTGRREVYLARYPSMAGRFLAPGNEALVALPLSIGDRPLGVLGLGFGAEFEPTAADLEALTAFAGASAWALEAASLREAEATTRRTLEGVIAQMPLGVAIADANGRLTATNEQHGRIWGGVRSSDDPGADGDWVGHHADGRRYARDEWPLARALRGEVIDGEEIAIERLDGGRAVTRQWSGPIRDAAGSIHGAVVILSDITEEAEARGMRDAFIGVLSHELRTPVTTIYGNAQLLARPSLMPELREELIADISDESDRLLRMVQDLLVIARVERGVQLGGDEPISLRRFLERSVAAARHLNPLCTMELTVRPGVPLVTGDEGYLEQIVRNLISNGVKYGSGHVTVTVRPDDGGAAIDVADDGPGFPPGALEHIWELFWRGDQEHRTPGAGIGLYVSRRLAEAMGGTIEARNGSHGGAVVTVSLPARVPAAGEA